MDALQLPYDALAALLNCDAEEIAIVQSATTAWQQAFFGIEFSAGDRILTSVQEYASNYINFLQVCGIARKMSIQMCRNMRGAHIKCSGRAVHSPAAVRAGSAQMQRQACMFSWACSVALHVTDGAVGCSIWHLVS